MSGPQTPDTRSPAAAEPIAVTVIGGYLGAGKTTLVNHILRRADERVAVLVNDFGDIAIDETLIDSADGDTIALANGCICCSLVDGFTTALDRIRRLETRPDRLVIEASGVADPASIAAWGHGPGYELDATIVVVDAETARDRAVDRYVGDTVMAQLAAADVVVLNKCDLVDRAGCDGTRAWLAATAPDAVVVEAVDAAVDPLLLFGVGRRERPRAHAPTTAATVPRAAELFESWRWKAQADPVARSEIETMLRELPDSVVRAKGIVWLADDPERPTVVQRVGRRWSLRPMRRPRPGVAPPSSIVFIGRRDASRS